MASITTRNAENTETSMPNTIEPVNAISEADPSASKKFSQLLNSEEETPEEESLSENTGTELTLADIQQQFIDSTFRSGFNRTIERAKEMAKEMKE